MCTGCAQLARRVGTAVGHAEIACVLVRLPANMRAKMGRCVAKTFLLSPQVFLFCWGSGVQLCGPDHKKTRAAATCKRTSDCSLICAASMYMFMCLFQIRVLVSLALVPPLCARLVHGCSCSVSKLHSFVRLVPTVTGFVAVRCGTPGIRLV